MGILEGMRSEKEEKERKRMDLYALHPMSLSSDT